MIASFNSLPAEVKSIIYDLATEPTHPNLKKQEIKNLAWQMSIISSLNKFALSIVSNKLKESRGNYLIHKYTKSKVYNRDAKDELVFDKIGEQKKSIKTNAAMVLSNALQPLNGQREETDIFDIINIIPSSINNGGLNLNPHESASNLHFACITESIAPRIIKEMLKQGANPNEEVFDNSDITLWEMLKLKSEIGEISNQRFKEIEVLFKSFHNNIKENSNLWSNDFIWELLDYKYNFDQAN